MNKFIQGQTYRANTGEKYIFLGYTKKGDKGYIVESERMFQISQTY